MDRYLSAGFENSNLPTKINPYFQGRFTGLCKPLCPYDRTFSKVDFFKIRPLNNFFSRLHSSKIAIIFGESYWSNHNFLQKYSGTFRYFENPGLYLQPILQQHFLCQRINPQNQFLSSVAAPSSSVRLVSLIIPAPKRLD